MDISTRRVEFVRVGRLLRLSNLNVLAPRLPLIPAKKLKVLQEPGCRRDSASLFRAFDYIQVPRFWNQQDNESLLCTPYKTLQ